MDKLQINLIKQNNILIIRVMHGSKLTSHAVHKKNLQTIKGRHFSHLLLLDSLRKAIWIDVPYIKPRFGQYFKLHNKKYCMKRLSCKRLTIFETSLPEGWYELSAEHLNLHIHHQKKFALPNTKKKCE